MKHIEFLLEEPSAEVALNNVLPKILYPKIFGRDFTYKIHSFNNKQKLIEKLPGLLKGYRRWIPQDYKIVILIDEDRENCIDLKKKIISIVTHAGLSSDVIVRIVIEELEAWFFGDITALMKAYPRIPDISNRAAYRDPDTIKGGTWEKLEKVLQHKGYYSTGISKIKVARDISSFMNPNNNRSHSFEVFVSGIKSII